MKKLLLLIGLLALSYMAPAQPNAANSEQAIYSLVEQYARARETKDTVLLKHILMEDIDQLVSTGEWRRGYNESLQGMLRSSASRPGTRTLTVERIRFLDPENAIADARYVIQNDDGSSRDMWSTFIVVYRSERWKISAIRNMLPAG